MSNRLHNFSAGPAGMPTEVLQKAQSELLNWHNVGASVMEISHRSADYIELAKKAESDFRTLLNISDEYAVLFLQGGAALQFSAVPFNLGGKGGVADYLVTGTWSQKAYKEAKRLATAGFGAVNLVADNSDNPVGVPSVSDWQLSENASYFHYCSNETIHGIAIDSADLPNIASPIVADMSSDILSKPIDVNKFGLIYAGAQKNIGPAGLTLIIVRKDLLDKASPLCPMVMNYKGQFEADSMLNTPATYSWYLAGLVFEWLIAQGGVGEIAKINAQKADLLYQAIDNSQFYRNNIDKKHRSQMNVPFFLADESLNQTFLDESKKAGLLYLKGHRVVGGMRASIYNAVSLQSVQALTEFMSDFEKRYG